MRESIACFSFYLFYKIAFLSSSGNWSNFFCYFSSRTGSSGTFKSSLLIWILNSSDPVVLLAPSAFLDWMINIASASTKFSYNKPGPKQIVWSALVFK